MIPSVAKRDGGPPVALRGMTRALAALGARVTVATTDADGPGRLDVQLESPSVVEGVEYRYFARSVPGEYKFSWPLTRWLWRGVRGFDVVHVHALFSYATIPGCRAAERAGVPYVLRPLGTLAAWSLAQRAWKKAPYMALVERRHLRGAAAVHATSVAEAEAMAALGFADRTHVIPLGVDVAEASIADLRAARQVSAAETRPLELLFLSRLHPKKNVPLLIDAVARASTTSPRPLRLTIAGAGDAAYTEELRRRAASSGLGARVRFVGQLDGADKDAALDGADLFVLPSHDENFGIAAAEALGRGVPVLLSPGVALAPDVAAAGAGVVVAPHAEAIAAQLTRFAADPGPLAAMSRAAVELARERYSWTNAARQLLSLYRELPVRGERVAQHA